MKTSLLVRCEQCGYENFPQHRFCGMCGAELPPLHLQPLGEPSAPPPRSPSPPPREAEQQPVSGPSFLGLADEPAPERQPFSYLLEDEESSHHRGRYLVLILLVAAGVAAWHWRQDLRPIVARFTNGGSAPSNETASSPSAPTSASPSEVAPAMPASSDTQLDKPKTGVGDQPTTPPPQAASADTSPAASSNTPAKPDESQQAAQPQASGANAEPAGSAPSQGESATAAQTPAAARSSAKSASKTSKGQLQPATSSGTEADALEAQGENYLYGNGVSQNCNLAQKSLLAAAARSNQKALTVLGAMYATGHCTGRDLPVAYHWFARALHQDPSNTRIEQDLKVLWNQMTPDEQRLALRSGQ